MPTTAAQLRIRYLYHYQRYGGQASTRLEAMLRSNRLYLSSPARFNDPWDCRPWFDLSALDTQAGREEHIAWFMRLPQARDTDAEEMRRNPELLRFMVEDCSRSLGVRMNDEYRVYCLTPSDQNMLMWSHYSGDHKGICLQFNVRSEPFVGACQVSYQERLPLSTLPEHEDDAMTKALLTKSDVWSYEREFRVVAKNPQYASLGVPTASDGFVAMSENALERIIIGCGCTDGEADAIVEMVRQFRPRVAVRRARRRTDVYGLAFTDIHAGH
ncbi:DUF2971 domain-containing protein [Paraburkholderia silviterrae]|uniref:DUF2971 domain-containing protein n=1 Tax=Paraburkholderia silviterrae TaxID=2528715 RepID=A0A4R5M5J0_9BURK|nr:DUF2971 domain-containing protein [Paraburkholderia silviterrae]TDG21141.1 DUF2971 domain-containing protein [Paraburkholderia silviterrae]